MKINEIKSVHTIITETTEEDQAIVRVAVKLNSWLDKNRAYAIDRYRYPRDIEKKGKAKIRVIGKIKDLIKLDGDLETVFGEVKVGLRRFKNVGVKGRYYYKVDTMTHIIALHPDYIGEPGYHSTIAHELRHALDSIKSQGIATTSFRYTTPRDKTLWSNPDSKEFDRGMPIEINARIIQAQDMWANWVVSVLEKYSTKPDTLTRAKRKGIASFNRALVLKELDRILNGYRIKEYFKNDQRGYQRLINRMLAYANSTITEWYKNYLEKKFIKKPGAPG